MKATDYISDAIVELLKEPSSEYLEYVIYYLETCQELIDDYVHHKMLEMRKDGQAL